MATTDPTADLLRSLGDTSKWECRRGVPVFRAHRREFPERKLSDGTVVPAETVEVTDADLQGYADKLNGVIRASGELPPLTVGHRQFDPAFPEKLQPELTGFGLNYRVETVTRGGESFRAVLHDEYTPRDKQAVYRQYPYRSVDFHPSIGIVGVAMLVRPPELKLGTVYTYSAGRGLVTYAMGAVMADAANPTVPDDDAKAYAAFCKYMQRYSAENAGAAMGAGNATTPAPVSPPPPPAGYQAPVVPAVPPVTPQPQTYQAGAAFVLGADGRLVPYTPPAAPVAPANPAAVGQYAADIARLAADNAAIRQRLDAEVAARTRAECVSMLDPLRPVVTFSYEAELGRLVSLPDAAARAAHVKYMADHYGRLPSGGFIPVYQGGDHMPQPATAGGAPAAPKNYQAVLAYMNARPGMTYDQAEAALATAAK